MEKLTFRSLRADEIDCRVATINDKGITLLLYKDARCDMQLLDETVGAGCWQRTHELINGNLFCNVSIRIDNDWVTKQDVGVESYTEKEKGQASDSFKRACTCWGIGRELYTAPFIYVGAKDCEIKCVEKNGQKKYTTYDKFEVKDIAYDDKKNIVMLEIINCKTHQVVYRFGHNFEELKPEQKEEKITVVQIHKITTLIDELDITRTEMLKHIAKTGADDIVKLTKAQADTYIAFLEKQKAKKGVENAIIENAKENNKNGK